MEAASSATADIQRYISLLFFSITTLILLLAALLRLLRNPPWCACAACRAYLSSSWFPTFPNLADYYTHLLRLSPTATIHLHALSTVVTANPDNVQHILTTNFPNFPKGKPFSSILHDLLGRGIFNADGPVWRFQRKLASLELSSPSVRSFASSVVSDEILLRLLPLLTSNPSLDLQDVFRRFTFDTICKISFGFDPKCLSLSLPISSFAAAFDTASSLSAMRAAAAAPLIWKLKRLLNIGSERDLRRAIRMVNDFAGQVIRQRRRNLGFSSSQDLLSRFMSSVDDDKYLRDIVVSFLLAGRDTVAAGLTSFFLLLSSHPDVETAMLDEISSIAGGDTDGVPSYEELTEMHYVHAAIYESMRLYPPVQFDSKFCQEDDVLPDGTFVRKGTRVTYHPYAMGRMEGIWGDDCIEFRPERWLSGGVFRPESPFRYPVFQGGMRGCIGKELAVMEMKAVVVSVVRGFHVDVEGGGLPARFSPGLTATLRDGLRARLRRRRSCAC